jgi:hypothetical protein
LVNPSGQDVKKSTTSRALNGIGEVVADRPQTARVVNTSAGDACVDEALAL